MVDDVGVQVLNLEHDQGDTMIVVNLSAILIPGSTQENVLTSTRTLTCLSSFGTFWVLNDR